MITNLSMNRNRLSHNYNFLRKLFKSKNIEWSIVTKLLCGKKDYLKEVIQLDENIFFCDSRLSNIKTIKKISKNAKTVYIKPPPKNIISSIVTYADISFNCNTRTIELLNKEAYQQEKIHKIFIMIEMGDLREGVPENKLSPFLEKILPLQNIKLIGIGGNFNCLNGVMPSKQKLEKLVTIRQKIATDFNYKIPYISGGTTIVLPLLIENEISKEINHFRIGEALFCGTNLFNNKPILGMKTNIFSLNTQIIDITLKPYSPEGDIGLTPSGIKKTFTPEQKRKQSMRAIVDIGLLDVNPQHLQPVNKNLTIIGASSDMLVVDLKDNKKHLKLGDTIEFNLSYMGILSIINSRYIKKTIV